MNVNIFRTWRSSWSQVPHLAGLPRGRRDELRGQHRRQEPVRDRGLRHQGETQQAAGSMQWRHGQYSNYCHRSSCQYKCLHQVLATVKKGKPELRKKVMPAVVIRQRKTFRRKDGQFIYFEVSTAQQSKGISGVPEKVTL